MVSFLAVRKFHDFLHNIPSEKYLKEVACVSYKYNRVVKQFEFFMEMWSADELCKAREHICNVCVNL